jgi:predicted nucleic acid-binding protein
MCKNDTGKDFEDVVQCLAAKTNGCGVLVTNDKQFTQCGIEIMNSSEFLKRIEM